MNNKFDISKDFRCPKTLENVAVDLSAMESDGEISDVIQKFTKSLFAN